MVFYEIFKNVIKIFGPPEIRPWRRICYTADLRLILCNVTNSSPWPYFWGTKNLTTFLKISQKTVNMKVPFFFGYLYYNHVENRDTSDLGLMIPKKCASSLRGHQKWKLRILSDICVTAKKLIRRFKLLPHFLGINSPKA